MKQALSLWILIALIIGSCLYFADASYNPLVSTTTTLTYNWELMDDFFSFVPDSTTVPTTDQFFSSGWRVSAGGTASVSIAENGNGTIFSSKWRGNTGSTATGEGCTFKGGYVTNGAGFGSARGLTVMQFRFLTPAAVSDGTNRYFIGVGANNVGSCNISAITDGSSSAWFFYNDLLNGGKWQGSVESAAAASNTQCDTGVTFEANTIYKACILFNSDSTLVSFFISKTMTDFDCQAGNVVGTAQCTINTCNSIPNCNTGTSALNAYLGINKTVGTTTRELVVDYYYTYGASDAPR